jgi:hypothetical protein
MTAEKNQEINSRSFAVEFPRLDFKNYSIVLEAINWLTNCSA